MASVSVHLKNDDIDDYLKIVFLFFLLWFSMENSLRNVNFVFGNINIVPSDGRI